MAREVIRSGLYETLQYPYSYLSMDNTPELTPEMKEYIAKEKRELGGDFCRGCGYCMPCTVGIKINNCNRMSLLLRKNYEDYKKVLAGEISVS